MEMEGNRLCSIISVQCEAYFQSYQIECFRFRSACVRTIIRPTSIDGGNSLNV